MASSDKTRGTNSSDCKILMKFSVSERLVAAYSTSQSLSSPARKRAVGSAAKIKRRSIYYKNVTIKMLTFLCLSFYISIDIDLSLLLLNQTLMHRIT